MALIMVLYALQIRLRRPGQQDRQPGECYSTENKEELCNSVSTSEKYRKRGEKLVFGCETRQCVNADMLT